MVTSVLAGLHGRIIAIQDVNLALSSILYPPIRVKVIDFQPSSALSSDPVPSS